MSAEIIAFPVKARAIVTVTRCALAGPEREAERPSWHPPVLDGAAGWSIEALHSNGRVDRHGHFRHECVAWQEALALARLRGWKAERNSAVASRIVAAWGRA